MKTQFLMALAAGLFFQTCNAQTNPNSENVKRIVTSFAKAGETYDIPTLEKILHPNYRVIANQFNENEPTTILTREVYVNLIEQKKFGGTKYELKFNSVKIHSHTAMVDVVFKSEKADMHMYLLLTQDRNGNWSIVSDVPVMEMKG